MTIKVLYVNNGTHHKNHNSIKMYKNITLHEINDIKIIDNLDLKQYECVLSPSCPIDISKYPNTKFLFGPQFSIFPDNKLDIIKGPKTAYNLLSDWVIKIWQSFPICNNLNLVTLPFGVDTEKFIPTKKNSLRTKIMIYFKHRDPSHLYFIEKFLKEKNEDYRVFSYDRRYEETEYLTYLQESKFCIWIDAHESQGFALQEALSCDVPLLVWNITSMNQEYGCNYDDFKATTTPYWDNKCGEIFYDRCDFEGSYNRFIERLETYNPREFILENLSVDVCENRFIKYINNM